MKKDLRAWLVMVGLWGVLLGLLAAPLAAADLDDLSIVEVEWQPGTVFPGDEIQVRVTYQNDGDEAVGQETPVSLQVALQRPDGREIASAGEDLGSLAQLSPGEPSTIRTTLIAPGSGTYTLAVRLLAGDRVLAQQEVPLAVESPLPAGIAQLIAGLGMFVAVITIMALGTEIVIDSLKFFVGLKRKVSAMEAYGKLERELPGDLSALGVEAAAVDHFQRVARDLGKTLQPVEDATEMADQIRAGAFGEAYEVLTRMAPETGQVAQEELVQLKQEARAALRKGFHELEERLDLAPQQTAQIEAYLLLLVDGVTPESAASLSEGIFSRLQKWAPKIGEKWLQAHIDTLLTAGRSRVDALTDQELLPALEELGFDRETAKTQVEILLDELEGAARQSSLLYVHSLENLLKAVEERRVQTQSPLRKIYRRLRASTLSLWTVLLGIAAALAAFWMLSRFLWPAFFLTAALEFLLSLLAALLVGAGVTVAFAGRLDGRELGETLHDLEWRYNRLLGRRQPKELYGKVELDVMAQITTVSPTTAAQVLLEREDKHRDEEASRQRVLRVIALAAGVILAYLLQIDAAVLLDRAVPGVAQTINGILDVPPERLNAFWGVLPDNNRLTAGIILTGLAASAGSAFWHDQLGKLQSIKEQSEAAAKVLRRARELPEEEG